MHILKLAFFAFPLTLAAACGQVDSTPKPLTEKQSAMLMKELNGKVAGAPVNCISDFNATNTIRVSDNILLYRVSGRLVYQNTLRSACSGLARDNDIIVSEQFGSQKCKGDIIRLVDRTSGMSGGVCSLGAFVPYRSEKTTD
ncbi:hypothetical protein [Sphingorhabdus sp. EL138]|jgi:hypothetical protein|uniref:hypothetical protein n=1 Tax=Sphingorhabdus sp. EL138 TaxID=2073156 RepID=UPI0025EDBA28|nr:hypothetical protein [Sphingorhabdus sp. EL138]